MEKSTLISTITRFLETLAPVLPQQVFEPLCRAVQDQIGPLALSPEIPAPIPPLPRLVPVLSRVMAPDGVDGKPWALPIGPVRAETLYPQILTADPAPEYEALFSGMIRALSELPRPASAGEYALWLDRFDGLMMRYLWAVPGPDLGADVLSAPGGPVPDVCLYDRARIAAAFAAADHLHGRASPPDGSYRIISGGISGIQGFIFKGFGSSRKYRSKLLRGRSFAVSLLSELAALLLCREMGLPSISVILNAAGRFSILCPNTPETENALASCREVINDWLMKRTYGQTVITLSSAIADPEDFAGGRFQDLWNRMEKAKEAVKYQRVDLDRQADLLGDYFAEFTKYDNSDISPVCPLCGKRPARGETETDHYVNPDGDRAKRKYITCCLCRDHVFMGTELAKKPGLAVFAADAPEMAWKSNDPKEQDNRLLDPVFGRFQVTFTDKVKDRTGLLRHWNISTAPEPARGGADLPFRPIRGYVPVCAKADLELWKDAGMKSGERDEQPEIGNPMTLNLIALKAKSRIEEKFHGVAALGVLKADVDDLGMLMACGLEKERFTLPRIATLSRQLHYFFALDLPVYLEREFPDTYTVFAGGDDLFLMGPWNRMIGLAPILRKRFEEYVCGNPHLHFSAGISFHKPHTPIDRMAHAGEEALELSKHGGKDRLTLFDETVTWAEMETFLQIREKLEGWLTEGIINPAMLFRMNDLMEMVQAEKAIPEGQEGQFEDMSCAKWRSLLAYSVARNVARELKGDPDRRKEAIDTVVADLTRWLDTHRMQMKIPVWNIMYDRR